MRVTPRREHGHDEGIHEADFAEEYSCDGLASGARNYELERESGPIRPDPDLNLAGLCSRRTT